MIKKERCLGCRNDFYSGKNDLGIKECWNLKLAKTVVKKKVHIDQRPPWDQKPGKYLDCYNQDRYVFVKGDRIC